MTDEQQLADAFWQMNRAVLKINEILDRNPALAENLPVTPPRILDADEIAAECQLLADRPVHPHVSCGFEFAVEPCIR